MSNRLVTRIAVIGSTALLPMVAAGPVFATSKVAGQHYQSLGLTNTILLFVVTPLGIFGIVAALAALPSTLAMRRSAKAARTTVQWTGEPLSLPKPAPASAQVADPADLAAEVVMPADEAPVPADRQLVGAGARSSTARGGASAEW